MTREMIQEEGAELREEFTQELENELKRRADEFRANERKMQLVKEAAQRVHKFGKERHFPIAPVEQIVENFVGVCSLHDVTIEQFENDLKEMCTWNPPEEVK